MRIADWVALSAAFVSELLSRKDEWEGREIVSVYFGGGTPSLMPVGFFRELMESLRQATKYSALWAPDCEVTLEINPEDVNPSNAAVWKSTGVNRVSLGIQTFDDSLLNRVGRTHTGNDAIRAFQELRKHFDNISVDLIFGLPGQSVTDLGRDLTKLTDLKPDHISVYSLMYESGTALTALKEAGRLKPVEDESSEEMFQVIVDRLGKAGYIRYETSNYALPGRESRHNSGYWTGRAYVGIGPSAHSYDGRLLRTSNPADLKGYLSGTYNIYKESLTREERIEERIMLGLRMKRGIDLTAFSNDFGEEALHDLLLKAESGLTAGNLEKTGSYLRVTDKGLMISDTLILQLF